MDQKSGDYRDAIAAQLAAIGARLDSIFVAMKNDVETIKTQMFGTSAIMVHSRSAIDPIIPTHIAHPKHNLEPEDEPQGLLTNLVKGTIPSSPSFSAPTPPSPLAQPPTVTSQPPTSATPPHITVELPPKHIATYTSPCLTSSSNKPPPSPTITPVLQVPSPVLFTTTPIQGTNFRSSCTTDRITVNFNQVSK
ncbi:proline-rich receptor-like protein kinase PERK8 [Helianthus annuus]|uniref:proline-rich receptor-like protein kinase PERK8 n=1 Tax=Helianthus annuus TaxID=4232 RepID=UPI000B9073AB|nr:proline-rich receptor-like protein kinase PERK8 [Helianthus annuus]